MLIEKKREFLYIGCSANFASDFALERERDRVRERDTHTDRDTD